MAERLPTVQVTLSAVVSVCAAVRRLARVPSRLSRTSDRSNPLTGSVKTIVIESTGARRGLGVTSIMSAVGGVVSAWASALPGEPPSAKLGRQLAASFQVAGSRSGSFTTSDGPSPSVVGYQRSL